MPPVCTGKSWGRCRMKKRLLWLVPFLGFHWLLSLGYCGFAAMVPPAEDEIQAVTSLVSKSKVQDFLARIRDLPEETRRSTMEAALSQTGLDQRGIAAFLLSCLEDLSDKDEPEPKLPGILCSFCENEACRAAADDEVVRRRALSASLRFWRQNATQFTALRLLQKWHVREQDATGPQTKDFRRLAEDVLKNPNWNLLLSYAQACPGFVQQHAEKINDLVDKMCKEGSFKIAIQVAKCAKLPRVKELREKMSQYNIKVGARSEKGKEFAAILACEKNPSLRKTFVLELYRAGKLELAAERISTWGMDLQPRRHQQQKGSHRAGKFCCLPKDLEICMPSSLKEFKAGVAGWKHAKCIGFDTESLRMGKPSLLQLASEKQAILIDMLNFCPDYAPTIAPWSYGQRGLSCDCWTCFLCVGNVPGFEQCDPLAKAEIFANPRVAKGLDGLSLSTLAEEVLGKPINKARILKLQEMRASDWSRRPLLPSQQQYAAMDAWILVRLWSRLKHFVTKEARESGVIPRHLLPASTLND